MPLDPTKYADWEIAEAAEKNMKRSEQLAEELGITKDELLPHGHYVAKVDYAMVLDRLKDKPDGKFIEVTAITLTPLGEGKSTTTLGLLQGMGKRGKIASGNSRASPQAVLPRISRELPLVVAIIAVPGGIAPCL